jgi:hypothetical protein
VKSVVNMNKWVNKMSAYTEAMYNFNRMSARSARDGSVRLTVRICMYRHRAMLELSAIRWLFSVYVNRQKHFLLYYVDDSWSATHWLFLCL